MKFYHKPKAILFAFLLIGSVLYTGCSDDPEPSLELTSLTSGIIDLLGSSSATNVSVSSNIVAIFAEPIDPLTITASTVILQKGSAGVSFEVSGSGGTGATATLTIEPLADLDPGTEYSLTLGAIASVDGLVHKTKTITFTTAQ